MSARKTGRSAPSYQSKQSDDDIQRHKADRHHREGSGQDRFGQQAVQKELYIAEMQPDGYNYRLRSYGSYGPRDGQLVRAYEYEEVGTTSRGKLVRRK